MYLILWIGLGFIAHIFEMERMKTWCGVPVWKEPMVYAMFIPAAIIGPLMFLLTAKERE